VGVDVRLEKKPVKWLTVLKILEMFSHICCPEAAATLLSSISVAM
jgi:hypothetical protein